MNNKSSTTTPLTVLRSGTRELWITGFSTRNLGKLTQQRCNKTGHQLRPPHVVEQAERIQRASEAETKHGGKGSASGHSSPQSTQCFRRRDASGSPRNDSPRACPRHRGGSETDRSRNQAELRCDLSNCIMQFLVGLTSKATSVCQAKFTCLAPVQCSRVRRAVCRRRQPDCLR